MGPSGSVPTADEIASAVADRLKDMLGRPETEPAIPEPWTLAGVNTDGLRQLQERAAAAASLPLAQAVEIVLKAAESGDLARDDVARIVAARWDLSGETWLHYMADGSLMREDPGKSARPRRSVQQRA